jgi:hypothetical protein
VLALAAMLGSARADLASSLAAGRQALKNKDLPTALTNFKAAVVASPNDAEANALTGMARAAALVNSTEGTALLTKLGVSKTGRNVLDWHALFPKRYTSSKLMSDEAEGVALTNVVPEFEAAVANFAKVTSPAFVLNLSADETHTVAFSIDQGDILFISSLVQAAICGAHALDTQESNLGVGEIDKLLFSNGLTLERLLKTKPTLFTAETTAGAAAVKMGTAYTGAVNTYSQAVLFIRARLDSTGRLVALDPSQDVAEAQNRAYLEKVRDSLAATVNFDTRTQVNAGAFVAAPKGLRTLLPTLYKNNGPDVSAPVPPTVPDPTMGGVLPGMTAARVLEWFTKLKHDLDHGFRFRDDPVAPTVAIKSPRGRVKFENGNSVLVTGTAKDNFGVQHVVVVNDAGEKFEATIVRTNPKKVTWQVVVPVEPGTNTLHAVAYDGQPNPSKPAVVRFEFVKFAYVFSTVQGNGTVNPEGGRYQVGKKLKLTAKPAPGWILQQWFYNGVETAFGRTLEYTPPDYDSTVEAIFVQNPFPAVAGIYQGLLTMQSFDLGLGDFVYTTVGGFSLLLGANGSFTFSCATGGSPIKVKGALNGLGQFQIEIPRPGLPAWLVLISADLEFDSGVSIAVYDFSGPLPFTGFGNLYRGDTDLGPHLTIGLPVNTVDSGGGRPFGMAGAGYLALTRDKQGKYRAVGALPDGNKLSFSTQPAFTDTMCLPVFARLANGFEVEGLMLVDETELSVGGSLSYSTYTTYSPVFERFFDVYLDVYGAPYTQPAPGERIASLGDGSLASIQIQEEDPGVPGDFIPLVGSDFSVGAKNKVTMTPPNANGITLKFTAATGVYKGSYKEPDTLVKRTFSGVIVLPTPGQDPSTSIMGYGVCVRGNVTDCPSLELHR